MPTFSQRLGVAWKATAGIFSDTAARETAKAAVGVFTDDSAREAHGLLSGIFPGSVGAPPTRGARERIAAYADMPWLHAVADKVASGLAAVEWRVGYYKPLGAERAVRMKSVQRAGWSERAKQIKALVERGEFVAVEQHPMLDLLNGGNSFMTGLGMRKTTFLHYDLEGESFWIKERSGLSVPVGAWPIPPNWIMATPTPSDRRYRVSFRGWQGYIPDTEITWFQNHDPANPYGRGTGMARALADELETDEMAAKTVRAAFFNGMRPDFLIYPKTGNLTEPERRRLQHDWESQHQGFWRQFKGRFASREMGVHEFNERSFREQQMVQLREFERDTIIQVWGVPLSFLGIIEPGHSRATLGVEKYIFSRWVLVPRLESFRAMLQERLAPEYDERLIIDYVSPVEEDKDFELEAARAFPSSLRVDEWRRLQGLPPLDDEAGQPFLVPFNLVPTTGFDEVAALPAVPGALPPALAALAAKAGMRAEDVTGLSTDELLTLRRLYERESRW